MKIINISWSKQYLIFYNSLAVLQPSPTPCPTPSLDPQHPPSNTHPPTPALQHTPSNTHPPTHPPQHTPSRRNPRSVADPSWICQIRFRIRPYLVKYTTNIFKLPDPNSNHERKFWIRIRQKRLRYDRIRIRNTTPFPPPT